MCKFGGTSVADATRVDQVRRILAADPRRSVVVVSAPGKRSDEDQKITDLLLIAKRLAAAELSFDAPLRVIAERFDELAADLDVPDLAGPLIDELCQGLNNGQGEDWVASRGEAMCARIVSAALQATYIEPYETLGIDATGRPTPDSYERLALAVADEPLAVVPGFYGRGPTGEVKVFTRGGSDITGAVVARAIGATVYENWTDVSGLMMADPKLVPQAKPMREVTYDELRELSYMGARVLHEEAVLPVRGVGIPIHIRNSLRPDDPGTMIVPDRDPRRQPVIGVAGEACFTAVHVYKTLMNRERGFGRRLLGIIESHGISFEHSPTGIDSMSVVLRDDELGHKIDLVVTEIQRVLQPERIEVHSGLAMIALVGLGMAHQVGISARLFGALGAAGVNVQLISQGISELSIIVGVAKADFATAVRAIYAAFAELGEG